MSEYMDVEMDGKSNEEFAEEVCNALKLEQETRPNLANMIFVRTNDCVTAKDRNFVIGGAKRFRFYTDQGQQRRYTVDGNSKTRPLRGLQDAVNQVLQAI